MKYIYRKYKSGRETYTSEKPLREGINYADSFLHEDYDERMFQIENNEDNFVEEYVERDEEGNVIEKEEGFIDSIINFFK